MRRSQTHKKSIAGFSCSYGGVTRPTGGLRSERLTRCWERKVVVDAIVGGNVTYEGRPMNIISDVLWDEKQPDSGSNSHQDRRSIVCNHQCTRKKFMRCLQEARWQRSRGR
ncbi:uncharacterized protein PHALS_07142 [Plasmopara halstedii]|uniref:Uncharacterized protein n=1 Tax=Plasmopara halstedii TaxID=4781 RepID=A0A0P1B5C5_PLAHL|nr:uncharacterized protein PHALS_07142 [Plasmopara halstedii]CEG49377.1 hypothetical protein PHALS_07142 [Plasmopara halstedii]|eukprot:XP_024585746.1 hypothetical protein PHALS_07142 [Plasmopara halstedii]